MFILAIRSRSKDLDYKVWNMSAITASLLIEGSIGGIGQAYGTHNYSYGFGSGKGRSKTADYREAVTKIGGVIQIASEGFLRLEGEGISIGCVGYLLRNQPPEISKNEIIGEAFIEGLEEGMGRDPHDSDLAADAALVRASMSTFPAATHVALHDEIPSSPSTPEVKMYPVADDLTRSGKINRFSHGAIRLRSIMENARRVVHELPRKIIICDIDETTQVTAIKGQTVVHSTHEYAGTSRIFSSGGCGAINPVAVKAVAEKTGMSCDDILEDLVTASGARKPGEGFQSMRQLVDAIRLENVGPLFRLFIDSIVFNVAGLVALLGGIELLIITGRIGADAAPLRSMIVKRLPILRLVLDDMKNESDIRLAADITGRGSKVDIIVVRPDTDRQIAREIMALADADREAIDIDVDNV
jgi:acetate kinase